MSIKSYKYRIYPTKKQVKTMNLILDECRWLYNHLLEQRKNSWEQDKVSLSYFDQQNTVPKLKEERPSLNQAHSQSLQNVAVRIDLAFKAFFRRIKKGEKPGYPRFKGKHRYDSFTYPQYGFKLFEQDNVVKLSKIGWVKIRYSRPVGGKIKTCAVKKTSTGKWYITFSCEIEPNRLPKSSKQTGIDVGLASFLTFSDGSKIDNPRFLKQEQKELARVSRAFSKTKKGSKERLRCRQILAKTHERIRNKRENFAHQLSRQIVDKYGFIAVEDLDINNMKKDNFKCINRSINDVAWDTFIGYLSYKAEEAGRTIVKVNPAYTSQTCSNCGYRTPKKLSDRVYTCPCCDLELDRDHNAALNILGLGLQSYKEKPEFLTRE